MGVKTAREEAKENGRRAYWLDGWKHPSSDEMKRLGQWDDLPPEFQKMILRGEEKVRSGESAAIQKKCAQISKEFEQGIRTEPYVIWERKD